MTTLLLRSIFLGSVLCVGVGNQSSQAEDATPSDLGLLPYDTRWEYPHFLTFRPGNGQACEVNPPRFSWPYVPHVLLDKEGARRHEFCFQLSRSGDFTKPDHTIRTPYNFYNALPVLAKGRWHWRVGYWVGTKQEQWSAVRTFNVGDDAQSWDRTLIHEAARRLGARPHPRLGPPDGDWSAWRERLAKDPETAQWLESVLAAADKARKRTWWRQFPETDRRGKTDLNEHRFAEIGRSTALAALAYKLTGDDRFAKAKEHALALARFPRGGVASPEFHGAKRKWSTQITEFLALVYDWLYADLSQAERKTLLDSIEWRLRATYLQRASWAAGSNIHFRGSAVFCASHPYENFVWSLPAVLLTAGDLELSDELTPLCLNYLTGVTAAHGPDEGWNEGMSYGLGKGKSMLGAAISTAILLPELNLGRNPVLRRLGTWYAHLMPFGINRVPFGDYGEGVEGKQRAQQVIFRWLGWLTKDGRFARRYAALTADRRAWPSGRPWLDLVGATKLDLPAPAPEDTHAIFPEAGWVMASTQPPSNADAWHDAVGMIFQCRPRGGYSHSFRAENDYAWYAFGQTLSAGGGGMAYPDPHSRHSLSHNVVLVNGEGQEWNTRRPNAPYVGRLLAYRRTKDWTYWVGDATHAYQTVERVLRWHRHVVLVDARWFVVFDDLAMRPEAKPARFSWLYHVAPECTMAIDKAAPSLTYRMGDVHARVTLRCPSDGLEVVDLQGREGFKNPVTGEDMYEHTTRVLARKDRELKPSRIMAHNVWVTNRKPAQEWTVLAALMAWRDGGAAPKLTFPSRRAVTIEPKDGARRTVSFDPDVSGDVQVDLAEARSHAIATDPSMLPPTGRRESVTIGPDTYAVEWLARETFERDDWVSRWVVEGDSVVKVVDGRLHIGRTDPKAKNVATVWYRPELPKDVMVRFRAKPIPPAENNAANLNLFLHARENDRSPVRFGRTGNYKEYHQIPNYIVTFVGGYRPGWSRARRDPGFNLLHEAEIRSEVGTEYRIAVVFVGGRLRYYVDGKRIHDVTDPKPLPAGRFAIRTWSTTGWWDDVEFGRVLSD